MKINLPKNVQVIIQQLNKNGYEAYAVGGCVRDTILGRTPQDWDITTSAKPQEVKAIFDHTIDTGIAHGTVTIMIDHEGYEVTTYRIDGEYEDARHPKEVIFTGNLLEDLKRRDFTINAMAYNDEAGLVDAFDGMRDLEEGRIRCVGNPVDRFSEDALRMLRAVRFAAQLGFEIEEETKQAVRLLAANIAKVSAERIQTELVKLLISKHPEKIRQAYELGLSKVFLPEFDAMMETNQKNKHHIFSVGEHTIRAMMEIMPEKVLRITALLHDVAKPVCITTDAKGVNHFYGHPQKGEEMAKEILKRLKFDNDTIRAVGILVRNHDDRSAATEYNVRLMMSKIGEDMIPALLAMKYADTMAQSDYCREEKLAYIKEYEDLYHKIQREGQCISKRQMAIGGQDLIALGMKPGKAMGALLDSLFDEVLKHPEWNTREKLIELAHKKESSFI